MLIESLIRRKGGSTVTLGSNPVRTYKFVPTPPDPRHLADVTNEDDIGTLLAIKEGFRLAKGSTAATQTAPAAGTVKAATTGAAQATGTQAAAKPTYTVGQIGGAKGKWFVLSGTKPVSAGYPEKSLADEALSEMEQKAGE